MDEDTHIHTRPHSVSAYIQCVGIFYYKIFFLLSATFLSKAVSSFFLLSMAVLLSSLEVLWLALYHRFMGLALCMPSMDFQFAIVVFCCCYYVACYILRLFMMIVWFCRVEIEWMHVVRLSMQHDSKSLHFYALQNTA